MAPEKITWARYVGDSHVEDYFRLGWMMAEHPAQYDSPEHELCWLMVWPCDCQMVQPKRNLRNARIPQLEPH